MDYNKNQNSIKYNQNFYLKIETLIDNKKNGSGYRFLETNLICVWYADLQTKIRTLFSKSFN